MQLSVQANDFARRWRAAAAGLVVPGAVLACAWALYLLPFVVLQKGTRSVAVTLVNTSLGPVMSASLLVVAMAAVAASRLKGRTRMGTMIGAAMLIPALGGLTVIALMTGTGWWPAPPWSTPVLWWGNYGGAAMICVGAVIVEDQRERSRSRSAALRDARLRAAEVVRRTVEVRLQAARARVEPRFLFDALSAVERVYDADAVSGRALLDDLVTYLRAVVPDLHETQSNADRETEIARLRLGIERAIAGGDRP